MYIKVEKYVKFLLKISRLVSIDKRLCLETDMCQHISIFEVAILTRVHLTPHIKCIAVHFRTFRKSRLTGQKQSDKNNITNELIHITFT